MYAIPKKSFDISREYRKHKIHFEEGEKYFCLVRLDGTLIVKNSNEDAVRFSPREAKVGFLVVVEE